MSNIGDEMQIGQIGGSGFTFSGAKIENLGSTEYTLATICIDETGSVQGFSKTLRDTLVAAVEACKKSPRSDNILVRVLLFGSQYTHGCVEVHGFKPLVDIDTSKYPQLKPSGLTPLNDTIFSAIGATNAYGAQLSAQDYGVNAIVFVVTDGGENASTASMKMVKDEIEQAVRSEQVESLISILIGVDTKHPSVNATLASYLKQTGMTSYIDAGDATATQLAKVARFISQSVSSQSQSIGTGGPSQNIAAVI